MKKCCSNCGYFIDKSLSGLEESWCNCYNEPTTSDNVCEDYQ